MFLLHAKRPHESFTKYDPHKSSMWALFKGSSFFFDRYIIHTWTLVVAKQVSVLEIWLNEGFT
jgi:hypothetical protein